MLGTDTCEFNGSIALCLALAQEVQVRFSDAGVGLVACPCDDEDAITAAAPLAAPVAHFSRPHKRQRQRRRRLCPGIRLDQ
jgi:hypothetical protein